MNPALDQRGELRFSPLETPSLRYPRQDRRGMRLINSLGPLFLFSRHYTIFTEMTFASEGTP